MSTVDPYKHVQIVHTPDGQLSLIRPVAEKLLKEGVICGKLDDKLHASDAAAVKAAMITNAVCDFCSTPGATSGYYVPDFDMPVAVQLKGGYRSTGGWATCDICTKLIEANDKKGLLNRAVESLAFPKFSRKAIEELHQKFWTGLERVKVAFAAGKVAVNYVNDTLPLPMEVKITDRDKRIRAISEIAGLSRADIDALIDAFASEDADVTGIPPEVVEKLIAWQKRIGRVDEKMIRDLVSGAPPPVPPALVPHWQRALDAKFAAAAVLRKALDDGNRLEYFPEALDLTDATATAAMIKQAKARIELKTLGYDIDLRFLPGADTYSFNQETAAAIREAALTLPREAMLNSVEMPSGCGWFWFDDPLPVATSPIASKRTHALLWGYISPKWEAEGQPPVTKPSIMFSAYVLDDTTVYSSDREMLPSTRWFWPLDMSVDQMLEWGRKQHRATYGDGTPFEHDPLIVNEDVTMAGIEAISLFFMQACLWFRQTVPGQPKKKLDPILTKEPGHIERHARKRYQREHKLDEPPKVHVVALRKTAKVERDPSDPPVAHGEREYHCRYVVKGHSRLQPYGPGRKERKLIWISSFIKGPDDMPLRTKTTVYAVVR